MITCPNCGNTTHASKASTCAKCGHPLPSSSASGTTMSSSASPVLVNRASGTRYHLDTLGTTTIGSYGCSIVLSAPGVSPKHAKVDPTVKGFVVTSLGPAMKINGKRLIMSTNLKPGDTLTVGTVDLTYELATSPATASRTSGTSHHTTVPAPKASSSCASPSTTSRSSGADVDGEVIVVDTERIDSPPFDWGRSLVIFSVIWIMLNIFVMIALASLVLWLILILLGGSGCLLIPAIPVLSTFFYPIIRALLGRRKVPIVNFQILDSISRKPVDVMLVRRAGTGGNIRLGDKVRVWGKRLNHGAYRAYRVEVYKSSGHPTRQLLKAQKPWSLGLGLVFLGVVIAVSVMLWTSFAG